VDADVLSYNRVPEHDGPNYLWTRQSLRIRGVYHPLKTSWVQVPPGAPVPRAGFRAPVTDAAIRHALAQPRRQLLITNGAAVVLESPVPGFDRDAANGPFCRVNDVVYQGGTKSYLVDLTIETCVNESYRNTATPSVMISHTTVPELSHDQDAFSTRLIHGHAVFNAQRLVALGASADDFRAFLFARIPPGFQRVQIQTSLSDDGNELTYTIVDRERAHSFGSYALSRNVTRIESTHTAGHATKVLEEVLIKAGVDLVKGFGNLHFGDALKAGQTVAIEAAPRVYHLVEATVWGNRMATRTGLEDVAKRICDIRLDAAIGNRGGVAGFFNKARFTVAESSITHDLAGKYVQARLVAKTGPYGGVASGGLMRWPIMPQAEDIGGVLQVRAGANPTFPARNPEGVRILGDVGARGTYLEALIASALLGPDQTPPAQLAWNNAVNRTPP
jgi:hypothetical protein